MSEQVLDVMESARILRRSWRWVAAFLVAGIVGAGAYEWLVLPRYVGTSLVLLPAAAPTSSTASTTPTVTTEARIATSAAVLVPAAASVHSTLSLDQLQARVTASDAAAGVLRISATGSTPHAAEALANAVATHLVQFVASTGTSANTSTVAGLHSEAQQLKKQIADAKGELSAANRRVQADGPTSAAGRSDAALVGTLTSQQQSLELQLNSVDSQIAQAGVEGIATNAGTEVIQRATTAARPSVSAVALPLVLGALGGLFVGAVVLLLWRRNDPRLWTRDALAGAVGAPVLASLKVRTRRTAAEWTSLLERDEPSPLEQWTVRRSLRELGIGEAGGRALTVVCLAGDPAGITQAVLMAVASAAAGLRTTFDVLAVEDDAAPLRTVCLRYQEDGTTPRPGLQVGSTGGGNRAGDGDADVTITVLILGSHQEAAARSPHGVPTVLSVSAGQATAQQLAAAAIATADGVDLVAGLLVANPTTTDPTIGRFPDLGARTARLRTRPAPGAPKADAMAGRAR